MRTWSLTPFFNELDLLEIRLAELDPVVDVHVIAEATRTYSGMPKPLHFLENEGRFAPWKDKIRYVVVDDMPDGNITLPPEVLLRASPDHNWRRENHQRDALRRGLEGMQARDKVMISDMDEIVQAEVVRQVRPRHGQRLRVSMALHLYWLNWRWSVLHRTPIASFTTGATMTHLGPQKVRLMRVEPFAQKVASGWHFSYQGGTEAIQHKIVSAAHQEVNDAAYNRRAWIEECRHTGQDLFFRIGTMRSVSIELLPEYVGLNYGRFSHMIGPELGRQKIGSRP